MFQNNFQNPYAALMGYNPQPQATRSLVDQTITEGFSLPITTLVQVKDNNSCRCCDAPTIIQFVNQGVAWVGDVNVVVTKLC